MQGRIADGEKQDRGGKQACCNGDHRCRYIARGNQTDQEVSDDAGDAIGQQQSTNPGGVHSRDQFQQRPHVSERREVTGNQQQRQTQPEQHLTIAQLPREMTQLYRCGDGKRRNHRNMQQQDQRAQQGHAGECLTPSKQFTDPRAQRHAQHRGCCNATKDDGGGQSHALRDDQSYRQTACNRPDPAHAHAYQQPGCKHPCHVRRQCGCGIGHYQQHQQTAQDPAPVDTAGGDHHHRCEKCRQQRWR